MKKMSSSGGVSHISVTIHSLDKRAGWCCVAFIATLSLFDPWQITQLVLPLPAMLCLAFLSVKGHRHRVAGYHAK